MATDAAVEGAGGAEGEDGGWGEGEGGAEGGAGRGEEGWAAETGMFPAPSITSGKYMALKQKTLTPLCAISQIPKLAPSKASSVAGGPPKKPTTPTNQAQKKNLPNGTPKAPNAKPPTVAKAAPKTNGVAKPKAK